MTFPRRTLLTALLLLTLCAAVRAADAVPTVSADDATIWIVCEPIHNKEQLDLAMSMQPHVILRGWFKWGWAPDWREYKPIAEAAAKRGTLFGGGVTCSAIVQGEMGLSDERFRALVTRTPRGEPAPFYGKTPTKIYHGAVEKREYLDYVLSFATRQIDGGADTLFMDEVAGAATPMTGYTDRGLEAFRDFLVEKYVDGAGWTPNDAQWTESFKIALDNKEECPDGTIRSFNYRTYLGRMEALDDPLNAKLNPLAAEWGPPKDRSSDTYSGVRNQRAWKYLVEQLRAYAKEKGRTVLLTANGLNRHVDFQTLGIWGSWPVEDGRLITSPTYLSRWRGAIDRSRNELGRDVPVVVFHDWGFGIPWEQIPAEDRILWLRTYAPEIFASGAFFAWPVSGCGGQTRADKNGTFEEIWYLTRWYRRHAALYHNHTWIGEGLVKTEPEVVTTLFDQTAGGARRIVHVINRRLKDHALVPRKSLTLQIPSGIAPKNAYVVSPDTDRRAKVTATQEKHSAVVTLPELKSYSVVVLEYDRPPNDAHLIPGELVLGAHWAWDEAGGSTFTVGRKGIAESDGPLSAFLHGVLHKERRVTPTLKAAFSEGATMSIHINSAAQLGAELVVRIDGKEALREKLPDKDGHNNATANEYDKTVRVDLPAGAHTITLENTGGDWLTLDRIAFSGILARE